ncbi:MAG: putative sugar transferase EpsL [Humibacillus sp.]|nr:putative sugar transferase EpsL [Humibacillus sp.]
MVNKSAAMRAAPVPARSWVAGFHGVVRGEDLDTDARSSLCALALGHRSLGTQRMQELTFLPGSTALRSNPRSTNGYRHLGRDDTAMEHSAASDALAESLAVVDLDTVHLGGLDAADAAEAVARLVSAPPRSDGTTPPPVVPVPWDPSEPLPDYLERRLGSARFLYLPNRSRAYRIAKRVLDIVGALALLLVTAPLLLVIALLIRHDSPGPAVFRQQRVTRGGRVFTFYKFRTMWVDARDRYPELYDYQRSGPFSDVFYKLEDDPRNTGVGRWLRRTTLDELPNLVNVLRGEMSLVGPRPELPELIAHYRPEDLALFFTKAGLTGLAQVSGRSLLTVHERITLDLRYVAQQTLLLDLRIILRTAGTVLKSKGAF